MTGYEVIFVYGSLLKGEANHALLLDAEYLGPGRTLHFYRLMDLGPYPGLLPDGATAVAGEIYRMTKSLMAKLDALEEHPDVYIRTEIRLEDGRMAWTYLLRDSAPRNRPEIQSGDWRAYRMKRDSS